MNEWRVSVMLKPQFADHRGESIRKDWKRAFGKNPSRVRAGQIYEVSGHISEPEARRMADELLTDPVTQWAEVVPAGKRPGASSANLAEIWPKKGVTDPVADTVLIAARDLGLKGIQSVRSGSVYEFQGIESKNLKQFCADHLMNELVQSLETM